MTVASYALGRPPAPALRGGDCRARDLNAGHNVFGPHRFASPAHCRISNGMLRVTVEEGATPSLTIEAYRPDVTIGDLLSVTVSDTLPGSLSDPEWIDLGTLTIDSPSVSALLSAVRLARVSRAAVTIRLVAPAIADALVTLRRGERMLHVQHGSTRSPLVATDRRIVWTGPPALTGTAVIGRVVELTPTVEAFPRFVASHEPVAVNAGAFSLTATGARSVSFAAGVGLDNQGQRTEDLHSQFADASTPELVVA